MPAEHQTPSPDSDGTRHRSMIDRAREQASEATANRSQPRAPLASRVRFPDAELVEGFRLLDEIHRGGQGLVVRAVQVSTGRMVAVKLLPDGAFATRAERLRFEREVEILSGLSSPGIVRIIESGVASGRWWFAMDLVDGAPLDRFLREDDPLEPVASVRRAVGLVAQVAEAVGGAHLRGVIHRDLKPSNILVDRDGRPHVLDFGLAKRFSGAGASDASDLTATGQFVGSLPWASPEQIVGGDAAVDVRTDVYSLGVVLFHAVTGEFPYQVAGPAHEVSGAIVSAPPIRPSSIDPAVDSDLETVLLRALAKEPERRYQSAADFGRDLRRWLAGEPLDARRDSPMYLLRSWLGRHRAAAATAIVLAATILAAGGVLFHQWRSANQQRDRAVEAESEQARLRAVATAALRRSQAANRFLVEVIRSADPARTGGESLSMLEAMHAAARQVDAGALAGLPDEEATVRASIAEVLVALGRIDEAATQAERARELREWRSADAPRPLAESLLQLSEIRSLQARRDEGIALAEAALAASRTVPDDADPALVAACLRRLAWCLAESGDLAGAEIRLAEAESALESTLDEHDPERLLVRLDRLVLSHGGGASVGEAEAVLEGLRVRLGPLHPQVQAAAKMLAATRQMAGDFDAAGRGYQAVAEAVEAVYGPDHPLAVEARLDLIRLEIRRGDPQSAFRSTHDLEAHARRTYAAGSIPLANFLSALGGFAIEAERWSEAHSAFGEALDIFAQHDADRSLLGLRCRVGLASAAIAQDAGNEAEGWARAALELVEPLERIPWARTRATLVLGQALLKRSAFGEAETALLEAYRLASGQAGPGAEQARLAAARSLVLLYEGWASAESGRDTAAAIALWRDRQR